MLPKPIITQITTTIIITVSIFLALFSYISFRHLELSLFIANKAVAGAAAILLSLVILAGPLGRVYLQFTLLMRYRKWMGISAFFLSYVHMMISLYFLPSHFPLSRFHLGNAAFVFGTISTLTLVLLFLLSFDGLIGSLNRKVWWMIQNWGLRIAFIFASLHIVVVKYPKWIVWFTQKETGNLFIYPPAGLLIACVMVYAIMLRILEHVGREKAKRLFILCTLICASFVFISFVVRLAAISVNQ